MGKVCSTYEKYYILCILSIASKSDITVRLAVHYLQMHCKNNGSAARRLQSPCKNNESERSRRQIACKNNASDAPRHQTLTWKSHSQRIIWELLVKITTLFDHGRNCNSRRAVPVTSPRSQGNGPPPGHKVVTRFKWEGFGAKGVPQTTIYICSYFFHIFRKRSIYYLSIPIATYKKR